MNTLLVLLKNNKLDIKTILKLFDRMVASIVLYSSELKGLYDYKEIDQIHLTFYKFFLGVKQKNVNYCCLWGTWLLPIIDTMS